MILVVSGVLVSGVNSTLANTTLTILSFSCLVSLVLFFFMEGREEGQAQKT